jgi:hypothetical protein
LTHTERFEVVGDLYYAATGHLRPGKDHPHEDSSDPENVQRFEQWVALRAFTDAIGRIVALEKRLAEAERATDDAMHRIGSLRTALVGIAGGGKRLAEAEIAATHALARDDEDSR